MIQLGYLSLLMNKEITFYHEPLADLSYVFGYNGSPFSQLPQSRMHSPYYLYGFQTYFGYTNNIMVIITAGVYAIAVVLLIISMLVAKGTSKRIKKASYYVATELAYALVVFSTPNMVTSICLEIKEGTIADSGMVWSRLMFIGSCVMFVVAHFLNLATAEQNMDIGTFFRSKSRISAYVPVIFNIRLILLTLMLFLYHFS